MRCDAELGQRDEEAVRVLQLPQAILGAHARMQCPVHDRRQPAHSDHETLHADPAEHLPLGGAGRQLDRDRHLGQLLRPAITLADRAVLDDLDALRLLRLVRAPLLRLLSAAGAQPVIEGPAFEIKMAWQQEKQAHAPAERYYGSGVPPGTKRLTLPPNDPEAVNVPPTISELSEDLQQVHGTPPVYGRCGRHLILCTDGDGLCAAGDSSRMRLGPVARPGRFAMALEA